MSNYAGLINSLPMDPADDRLLYGIDLVNVVDDGGTLVNPTATVSVEDAAKGVVISDVVISGTRVMFRPIVQAGNQADAAWDGDGVRVLVTTTIEDANAKKLSRSGYLWIANR